MTRDEELNQFIDVEEITETGQLNFSNFPVKLRQLTGQ